MRIHQVASVTLQVVVHADTMPSQTREYRSQDGWFWRTTAVEPFERRRVAILSNPPNPLLQDEWLVTLRRSRGPRGAALATVPESGHKLIPRFTLDEIRAARDAVRVAHPELLRVGTYSEDAEKFDDGLLLVAPSYEVSRTLPEVFNEIPTRIVVESP